MYLIAVQRHVGNDPGIRKNRKTQKPYIVASMIFKEIITLHLNPSLTFNFFGTSSPTDRNAFSEQLLLVPSQRALIKKPNRNNTFRPNACFGCIDDFYVR